MLARLTATAYSLVVILVVFSALRPTAAGYAAIAGRRAALLSRARAEHAAAAAVQQDRHDRLALLEAEALPLLRAVDGVFRALPPHPVTLTVLDSAEDVELYVAFAHPPRATPEVSGLTGSVPAAAGWQAAVDVDETGAGCLEVRWRKQEAA
ncbi:MAG: hypothetical protein ACRDRJ_39005 [Streptosporangiaceae bacterium]